MIAIITGDLVNSASADAVVWAEVLKKFLARTGRFPADWEIYRGDSFQFGCKPEEAFHLFLLLKSMIRQIPDMDVRVSIGIGTVDYQAERISESNGSAFVHSGRAFDRMKEREYLVFSTGDEKRDHTLNLFGRFASLILDNWSASVAETVQLILEKPGWNQQQIADELKINQSAVSQNRKRAQLDLILDFEKYFISSVKNEYP